MFRAEISEEALLSISCIKGLSPEILLFKKKGTVSRDFSLRDGILPTAAIAYSGDSLATAQIQMSNFERLLIRLKGQ
jgi:hypothetical protein